MQLADKIALVTGGGSGIGLATALALAKEGCRVAIAGRNGEKLRAAAEGQTEGPPIISRACDVAEPADVAGLFDWLRQQIGAPEILVNSAGINVRRRSMAELDPGDWEQMIRINQTGAFHCIRAALPEMRRRQAGLIVNISSVSGKRASALGGPGYCASKFALAGLGTAIGLEERANGIHVTNIYPGEVATPILAQRPTPVPPERLAAMLRPEDIAEMVVAIARLPDRAIVPELVITPMYQEYA